MSSVLLRDYIKRLNLEIANIQKEELISKAQSYLGALNERLSSRDKFGTNCKLTICLYLAGKSIGIILDHKSLSSLSATSLNKYEKALKQYTKILDIQLDVDFKKLAVKFNHPELGPICEKHFEFVRNWLESKAKVRAMKVDESTLKLAMFFTICKGSGFNIDKSKLLKEAVCVSNEFKFLTSTIEKALERTDWKKKDNKKEIPDPSGLKRRMKKVRSPFSGYAMIKMQPYYKTTQYQKYLIWKSKIINNLEKDKHVTI